MLRELLNSKIINVSGLAELTGIKKQYISRFKITGKGLTKEQQEAIIKVMTNVIQTTLPDMTNDIPKPIPTNLRYDDKRREYYLVKDKFNRVYVSSI